MEQRQKVYAAVIEYIKALMSEGKVTFGGKLPSEREMMGTLGMGRNSIREALRTLEHMGVVESRQGQGNFLVNRMGQSLNSVFSMLLFMRESDDLEISQLRRGIEIEAFSLAVQNAGEEEKKRIESVLEEMKKKTVREAAVLDRRFHEAMIDASGNHLLKVMMEALAGLCEAEISHVLDGMEEEDWSELLKLHEEIFWCLKHQELPRGIELLQRHYDQIIRNICQRQEKAENFQS